MTVCAFWPSTRLLLVFWPQPPNLPLLLPLQDSVVTEADVAPSISKRLRTVKSVESLISASASLHSNRNSQVGIGECFTSASPLPVVMHLLCVLYQSGTEGSLCFLDVLCIRGYAGFINSVFRLLVFIPFL